MHPAHLSAIKIEHSPFIVKKLDQVLHGISGTFIVENEQGVGKETTFEFKYIPASESSQCVS